MRILLLLLIACSNPTPEGHAQITTRSLDLELPVSSARLDNGQLVVTWTTSGDAGIDTPFFQIKGVRIVDGDQDPIYTQVAFLWPGSHDTPRLHSCDCNGSIRAQVDETSQKGDVDLDLMVGFTDESGCPGDCPFTWYTTDLGTFFVPDRPCDGGTACLDNIVCPGQSAEPEQVYPDDAGGFTWNAQECANPGLTKGQAHVVAHSTLTRDQFGY